MMTFLGMAAAVAVLVLIWFLVPVLMAPLVLAMAVVDRLGGNRTRRAAGAELRRTSVHDLPAVHPTDARVLAA
ncbi:MULTISPECIES: hypothetical protein [unclassified Luteococcus]|uniref:hypothetical protein n=1 Tax=unclassified Luteococcus TaxID=2639923 RepID=UPI00313E11C3